MIMKPLTYPEEPHFAAAIWSDSEWSCILLFTDVGFYADQIFCLLFIFMHISKKLIVFEVLLWK